MKKEILYTKEYAFSNPVFFKNPKKTVNLSIKFSD